MEDHKVKVTWNRPILVLIIIGYTVSMVFLAKPIAMYASDFYAKMADIIQTNRIATGNNIPQVALAKSALYVSDIPHMRLKIPSIKVDASIESMKVSTMGELTAPKGPEHVGLFKLASSSVPAGEISNVVIDGHRGWYKGSAVFDELHNVKLGDKIYVEDVSKAATLTFIVKSTHSYLKGEDTSEVFSQKDDGLVHLNLITCDGDWDVVSQSYAKRLVVFAVEG